MDAGKATPDFDRLMLTSLVRDGKHQPWRREIAVLQDASSSVRVWLDTSGSTGYLLVEDIDSGDHVELDATQLFQLVVESVADDSWAVRRTL